MAADREYRTLDLTETFLETYAGKEFSEADRRLFRKALRLLDDNEKHPSLRVHKLQGDREGSWSASASDELRMTFERLAGGRKRMLTCSRHYGELRQADEDLAAGGAISLEDALAKVRQAARKARRRSRPATRKT